MALVQELQSLADRGLRPAAPKTRRGPAEQSLQRMPAKGKKRKM